MSQREELVWRRTPETTQERVQRHISYLFEDAQTAGLTLLEFGELIQKFVMEAALELEGWNICRAARLLGVHRNVFSYRMRRHGIRRPHGMPRGGQQQCRCGRMIGASALAAHMRVHARRGEVRILLPRNSDRFEYRWLREPTKVVA